MTDPLNPDGLGTGLQGHVDDAITLVTSYVPAMVAAILFGAAVGIGFRWVRRAVRTAGSGR